MIYGYFDESEGADYTVVAGLIGRKNSWKSLVREWTKATRGEPVHLIDMRLGSNKAEARYGPLLRNLGPIPARYKLRPFVGVVKTSDYLHRIKGTTAELALAGYMVALIAMIDAVMESDLRKTDRIQFIFEVKSAYAVARDRAYEYLRRMPEYMTGPYGKSRIARFATQEKSTILEPSDYLAHAILQHYIDENSQKAKLTAPIIDAYNHIDQKKVDKTQVDYLLSQSLARLGDTGFPILDKDRKAFIKGKMKEELEAIRDERA